MIALSDNPSIPHSRADDYCPENMSKKLLRSLYFNCVSLLRKPPNPISAVYNSLKTDSCFGGFLAEKSYRGAHCVNLGRCHFQIALFHQANRNWLRPNGVSPYPLRNLPSVQEPYGAAGLLGFALVVGNHHDGAPLFAVEPAPLAGAHLTV